jgi:hypothetical protein
MDIFYRVKEENFYRKKMESFELYIPPNTINPVNGQFRTGHKPFNKGVPMVKWMDGRKIRKVKKYLELGRKDGNKYLAGANRKPIVGIKDGKLFAFDSSTTAENIASKRGESK